MKLLLDSCVWGGARRELEAAGHDVVWAGDWDDDPGDEVILNIAHHEGRVLATLDKDFGELAIVRGLKHSGIVRLVGFRAREQGRALLQVLAVHGERLPAGAIATVRQGQLRLRL